MKKFIIIAALLFVANSVFAWKKTPLENGEYVFSETIKIEPGKIYDFGGGHKIEIYNKISIFIIKPKNMVFMSAEIDSVSHKFEDGIFSFRSKYGNKILIEHLKSTNGDVVLSQEDGEKLVKYLEEGPAKCSLTFKDYYLPFDLTCPEGLNDDKE